MTQADNCLDLFSGSGEQDGAGHDAEIRQAVALVSVQLFGRGNQAAFTNNRAKLLKNVGVHQTLTGYSAVRRVGHAAQF